jgi:hypothetical protein
MAGAGLNIATKTRSMILKKQSGQALRKYMGWPVQKVTLRRVPAQKARRHLLKVIIYFYSFERGLMSDVAFRENLFKVCQ